MFIHSSPIGRLSLSTVRPTLLPKRSPQATSHLNIRQRAVRNTSCSHLPNLSEELPLPCLFDTTPQDPSTHFARSMHSHPIDAVGFARRCASLSGRFAGQRPRGVSSVLQGQLVADPLTPTGWTSSPSAHAATGDG